jgi:hypothetical protein
MADRTNAFVRKYKGLVPTSTFLFEPVPCMYAVIDGSNAYKLFPQHITCLERCRTNSIDRHTAPIRKNVKFSAMLTTGDVADELTP